MNKALTALVLVGGSAAAITLVAWLNGPMAGASREHRLLCESMIREAATWGVLEIKQPSNSDDTWAEWKRGELVLTNGFGAHVSASANCFAADDDDPARLFLTTPEGVSRCTHDVITRCG